METIKRRSRDLFEDVAPNGKRISPFSPYDQSTSAQKFSRSRFYLNRKLQNSYANEQMLQLLLLSLVKLFLVVKGKRG
ncbi:hypothetical protein J2S13_003324 [Oikeobacillus pervagus]|uniref:Uncharacterized protein n=1 Tax=Oikeobacillus pervagus TaxID=1325931 RepID=A0AAJ1T403_9BACI|nr:hypothetical protein [Oikeobacillus pervagus]MDQ0216837.1 hypothetical protein [Oikeobacillus pervagus]